MKHPLLYSVLTALLCTASAPAMALNLGDFASALDSLATLSRAADDAHSALDRAVNGGKDYSRYERDWRTSERRLENERVRVMARMAGVSESRIREMRSNGEGWDRICRRYDVEPSRFGYGGSRYDHDRDSWRGTPPGLAKKEGGMPPGQYKKEHGDKGHGHGHDKHQK